MSAPPSSAGAVQERSICEVPSATALRPLGTPGTAGAVVALAVSDASPVPTELIADTR